MSYAITTEKHPRVFSFKSKKILTVNDGEFHMKVGDKSKSVSLESFAEQCKTE